MIPTFSAAAACDAVALGDTLSSGQPALVRAPLEPITVAFAQLEGEMPGPATPAVVAFSVRGEWFVSFDIAARTLIIEPSYASTGMNA